MLAFLDSPVQLMVLMVVVLIVFGPQKLPEIGQQIGRALRELRRTTSELTSSFTADDHHDPSYDPPRYDSYGNRYNDYSYSQTSAIPEEPAWESPSLESQTQMALTAPEPPRGDFASAALADAAEDYGVGLESTSTPNTNASGSVSAASNEVIPRPAEGTIPRKS
jgi:TatA/E family protein of Tat protein translocase